MHVCKIWKYAKRFLMTLAEALDMLEYRQDPGRSTDIQSQQAIGALTTSITQTSMRIL